MSSVDPIVGWLWPGGLWQSWPERSWLLVLAFTGATLCVAALRHPCRRLFGAQRAFQLWLLPPLAMLASQLPHALTGGSIALSGLVFSVVRAGGAWSGQAGAGGVDIEAVVVPIWAIGVLMVLAFAWWQQRRYRVRLRGAVPMALPQSRWPVLRAIRLDVGPALVGAWRPRIVLPADFESRYSATEQVLILAHETMHARRGDGCWCLFAQALAGVFWFHPLAWWAWCALRQDQELACDAAVLREHAGHHRDYAYAMLKTPAAALALPVGCRWSPRHPLTERIAMLKLPSPSRSQRHAGILAGVTLLAAVTGAVYAASAPLQQPASSAEDTGKQYQLNMDIELANPTHGHAERAQVALCMAAGEDGSVRTHGLEFRTVTVPAGGERVRVDLVVTAAADSKPLARTRLQGSIGQPLRAQGSGADGQHPYVAYITAQAGCPARDSDGGRSVKVSEHVVRGNAREVASSVASKAGWTLLNPELLSKAPISLDFQGVPAADAMRLVAEVGGATARIEGRSVRFVRK